MRKHYRKVSSDDTKLIIKIIESWDKRLASDDHVSLIEFTKEWVDKTDRGGLFLVLALHPGVNRNTIVSQIEEAIEQERQSEK